MLISVENSINSERVIYMYERDHHIHINKIVRNCYVGEMLSMTNGYVEHSRHLVTMADNGYIAMYTTPAIDVSILVLQNAMHTGTGS